jgi:class 3 adenylate cyclase/WD40 repeat protein/KaiC/GvpD/RAD55 family RecA-like ATPase
MVSERPEGSGTTAAVRTFVIADIRGWTAFTAERGDEAASHLAKKFAEVATEGIEAWGGSVVELRGDEVLAVFDSARNGLRAAAELQRAFAAETRLEPALPLAVGIGVDAGEAVPVGDGFRGAALNVAARLCAIAQAGETVATQTVTHLAGSIPNIEYEELAPANLKGLKQELTPVRITSTAEVPSPVEPSSRSQGKGALARPGLPAELEPIVPLAGRKAELRWLLWHWRRAGHGDGRCVVISGQPGIGKTRLASELATLAYAKGAQVSYVTSSARPEDVVQVPTDAASAPILVIVDDLDAASPELTSRINELSDALRRHRALLVVTHREEAAEPVLSLVEKLAPSQQRRQLGPLQPDAVRAIAALYAGRAADRIPVSEIIDKSGGVPAAIHRWSSAWARTSATQRLEASASRTSQGRRQLREAEDELIDDVTDLELIRDRTELFASTTDSARTRRTDICPYKGLAAFDAVDADYYFGRERLVAELIARLVGSQFVGLVGASGSGKSSALRAGLIPALAGGVLPGSDTWKVAVLRPGEHPLSELERSLGESLDEALAGLPVGGRLVLVVDQFEEVFNSTREEAERQQFVDLLTRDRERLKVVVAMRADHYGECAAYPTLARLIGNSQVLVGPLTSAELAVIIEAPAERVGLRVEPELTGALLTDLGVEPGALPLLSTALLELWQARDHGWLTLAAYRASGGVHGAVARMAENAYGSLTEEQRHIARSIFLRLAGLGEGTSVVRRRVPMGEFDPTNDEPTATVLQQLTDARLLTTGEGYVEVAHEALLREWPRLQQWLAEDAAGRQLRLHVIGAAQDWDGRGREPGELYRGARLAAALEWSAGRESELNFLEREFIQQSRLESEHEINRQRVTNRRLRILLAGVGVFLLVAIAAGGFAAYQSQLATKAEEFARSRELAASAIAARDQDPTLSKLLALEAASIAEPPVESVASLHRAWDADRIVYRHALPADHEASSVNADLDPSGRYIATGAEGPNNYMEVVDSQQGLTLWSFSPRTEGLSVSRPMFTPDGGRVVFGAFFDDTLTPGVSTDEAGIYVRDALTGAELKHIVTGDCGALVMAASEKTAIAATSSGEVCVRLSGINARRDLALESVDLESGERTILTPTAAGNDENAVSADGSTVVFQAFDGVEGPSEVVIQHLDTGARSTIDLEGASVHDITADGKVALIDQDERLKLWDVDTGTEIGAVAPDPSTHGSYAQFAPDGRTIFSTGFDGQLHEWDANSGDELLTYPGSGGRPAPSVNDLVLVPSAESPAALLIDSSLRGEVQALDATALAAAGFSDGDCGSGFSGSAIDAAGPYLVLNSFCRPDRHTLQSITTMVLDRSSLQPVITLFDGGGGPVLSPDGTRIARRTVRVNDVAAIVGPMEIDDAATGATIVNLQGLCEYYRTNPTESVLRQTRSDHGNPGCNDFPTAPFAMDSWQAHHSRWSPDGTMLVLVDLLEGYLGVWNTADGSIIGPSLAVNDPTQFAYDAVFTPDSKHLVVSYTAETFGGGRGRSNALAKISTSDWQVEATRDLPADTTQLLLEAPSTDSSALVGFSGFIGDNAAMHWFDSETLADARPSRDRLHFTEMDAVASSPDGSLFATGAADGSIRVWDTDGRLVKEMEFPGRPVNGLAFLTPSHLGVVLDDGKLRVETIDTNELLGIARQSLTRSFTQDECDRYKISPCPTLEEMRSAENAPR